MLILSKHLILLCMMSKHKIVNRKTWHSPTQLNLNPVLNHCGLRRFLSTLRKTSNFEWPFLFTGSTDFHFSFTDMKLWCLNFKKSHATPQVKTLPSWWNRRFKNPASKTLSSFRARMCIFHKILISFGREGKGREGKRREGIYRTNYPNNTVEPLFTGASHLRM